MINKNNLYINNVPIEYIKKNFVDGIDTNYEKYICEFINASYKFLNDYEKTEFHLTKDTPIDQSKGDLTNNYYNLELKMLVDNKTVEDKQFYELGKTQLIEGVIMSTESKYKVKCRKNNSDSSPREYQVRFLIMYFRNMDLKKFEQIEEKEKKQLNDDEKIVKDFIENIAINKNTLYFNPFPIYFKNVETTEETIKFIITCLNEDLKGFINYRKSKTTKDTFLAFITTGYIVFLKNEDNVFKYYDMVPLNKSILYEKISNITNI